MKLSSKNRALTNQELPKKEAEKRFDKTLKRMLNAPPMTKRVKKKPLK